VQTWWRHWALLVHAATAAGLELLRPEVAKAQEVRRKEHARQSAEAAAPVRLCTCLRCRRSDHACPVI
jgi:hypothetical protein